ncbi:MAG: DUF4397 domain-containing protein [Fimbriimonadaceae bacterium]|nr:DUF4397 domain-containing protein [Fimbriimonadaceae bacterium]
MARSLTAALLVGVLVALMGCGGKSSSSTAPDPLVRFFNGSPDSVALDLLFDDSKDNRTVRIGSAVPYASAGPNFVEVRNGSHDLILKETADPFELWAQVIDAQLDKSYLAVAFGLANYGAEYEKRSRFVTFEVDRTAPNGNKARLYVFHAFNRGTGLDTPAIDFQTPGENPLFRVQDVAYGSPKELTVDSGTHTFQARNKGTEFVYVQRTVTVGAGKIYLVLVSGVEDGAGALAPRIELIEVQPRR